MLAGKGVSSRVRLRFWAAMHGAASEQVPPPTRTMTWHGMLYGMVNDKMTRRQGGQDDMGDKATRVTRDVDQLILVSLTSLQFTAIRRLLNSHFRLP